MANKQKNEQGLAGVVPYDFPMASNVTMAATVTMAANVAL